jgi:hypothetical protein
LSFRAQRRIQPEFRNRKNEQEGREERKGTAIHFPTFPAFLFKSAFAFGCACAPKSMQSN